MTELIYLVFISNFIYIIGLINLAFNNTGKGLLFLSNTLERLGFFIFFLILLIAPIINLAILYAAYSDFFDEPNYYITWR